jgi:hypothetical protein
MLQGYLICITQIELVISYMLQMGFGMHHPTVSGLLHVTLLLAATGTPTLSQPLDMSTHRPRESWAYSAGTLVGTILNTLTDLPAPAPESDIDPAFIATPFNDSYLPLWDPNFDLRGVPNLHMSAPLLDLTASSDATEPSTPTTLAPSPIPQPAQSFPFLSDPSKDTAPAASMTKIGFPETWSGPLPSEAASSVTGGQAQGDIYSAELQGYETKTAADGTVVASGTVQYKAQNGTVLWIEALTAPLVKRDVLEYVNFYTKYSASTQEEVRRGGKRCVYLCIYVRGCACTSLSIRNLVCIHVHTCHTSTNKPMICAQFEWHFLIHTSAV